MEQNMRTLAIVGAGPGIGRAVGSRFGREGYRVALIARNEERLAQRVDELAGEGIDTAAFRADVIDRLAITSAVEAVVERWGPIDVLEYSPLPSDHSLSATETDAEAAQVTLDTCLLGAIHATSLVLPSMLERGDGALLFTQGASARFPLPFMSNVGMAMAGLRNWIYCLSEELQPKGIYVGTITIGAAVQRGADPANAILVEPDDVADRLWRQFQGRHHVEQFVGDPSLFTIPEGWT
jgi:NAD(P)-dependent dehydrogenase (short-subunit alcohol dehydrogenase family)